VYSDMRRHYRYLLKVIQALEWLDRMVAYSWLLLGAAVFLVTWVVIVRYVFYISYSWFEEVIVPVCLLGSLSGCGRVTKNRRQITLELFYVRLKGKMRQVADIVNNSVVVVVCGVLAVCCVRWGMFLDCAGITYSSHLKTPYSVTAYILAAAMILNVLYSLEQLLQLYLTARGAVGERKR